MPPETHFKQFLLKTSKKSLARIQIGVWRQIGTGKMAYVPS